MTNNEISHCCLTKLPKAQPLLKWFYHILENVKIYTAAAYSQHQYFTIIFKHLQVANTMYKLYI